MLDPLFIRSWAVQYKRNKLFPYIIQIGFHKIKYNINYQIEKEHLMKEKILVVDHIDVIDKKLVGTEINGRIFKLQFITAYSKKNGVISVHIENVVDSKIYQIHGLTTNGSQNLERWLQQSNIKKVY
jgi:hypothetical protein